jgi:hypothetical protein
MVSDPLRPDPISELARAAVRALAEGRAAGIENAIDRAYDETRIDARTRRPTRAELRAHARALEESEQGELGRLLRIDATLLEVSEVLATLEETVLARDPKGAEMPPPQVYGRAATGHFDLDPAAHIRVTTSLSAAAIAQSLFEAGFADPGCRSIETRHGRLDEVSFDGEHARYSIVRVPPRMAVDRDRDLVRGKPVEHCDFSGIARRLAQLRVRTDGR